MTQFAADGAQNNPSMMAEPTTQTGRSNSRAKHRSVGQDSEHKMDYI